jgi:hypothetical protein
MRHHEVQIKPIIKFAVELHELTENHGEITSRNAEEHG